MQTLNDFINGIYEIYRKSKECPEEWECLHESVYFNPILRAARSDDKQYSRGKLPRRVVGMLYYYKTISFFTLLCLLLRVVVSHD